MSIKQKFNMLYAPLLAFILGVGIMAYVLGDSEVEVIFSNTTGECVRVVAGNDIYSCDNLPHKYKKLWIN